MSESKMGGLRIDLIREAMQSLNAELFPTPLTYVPLTGASVRLKLETLLPTRNFKLRGTLNVVSRYTHLDVPPKGFITATSGNQGISLAYAARQFGAEAHIIIPPDAAPHKVAAAERWGGQITVYGTDVLEGEDYASRQAALRDLKLVSCCDTLEMIAGFGTLAIELLDQCPDLSLVLVPVGGGALLGGIAFTFAHLAPRVRVIGVQSVATSLMHNYLFHTDLEQRESVCDALAGRIDEDSLSTELCQQYVEDIILVDEAPIIDAVRWCLLDRGLLVEPSAACTVAALLSEKLPWRSEKVACVLSGGNVGKDMVHALFHQSNPS